MDLPLSVLLGVAAIWTVAVLSPGPAFLLVVHTALRYGRTAALKTVGGLSCGTFIWAVAGFFGISFLFSAVPWAYLALKLAGGGYLIYLGVRILLASSQDAVADPAHGPCGGNAWRRGVLTNLANPKAAAFVTSVYATTMPPDPAYGLGAAAVAIMVSITATWYAVVAVGLTTGTMARLYRRGQRWIERATGVFLIGFGTKMIADR